MAKAFSFLFVILSYSSYLSITIEVEPTPEEWVNPWDMTKYDAAAKTIDHGVSFLYIYFRAKTESIFLALSNKQLYRVVRWQCWFSPAQCRPVTS